MTRPALLPPLRIAPSVVPQRRAWVAALAITLCAAPPAARAAESPYAFEGTWVRAERTCTPATVRARTYTAKEVVSPRGRCAIRRIAASGNLYELLEECRFGDRTSTVTETVRMTAPDSMTLKRQLSRLKIPRQVRYARCSIAASGASPPHAVKPPVPESRAHENREKDEKH